MIPPHENARYALICIPRKRVAVLRVSAGTRQRSAVAAQRSAVTQLSAEAAHRSAVTPRLSAGALA
jgi:hypothetical protein